MIVALLNLSALILQIQSSKGFHCKTELSRSRHSLVSPVFVVQYLTDTGTPAIL